MYQLKCSECSKPVSSEIDETVVVRAIITCPECATKQQYDLIAMVKTVSKNLQLISEKIDERLK